MTKEEIKALIAEKIAGQGNQVDMGGALADILNAILDAPAEGVVVFPEIEEKTKITRGLSAIKGAIAIKVGSQLLPRIAPSTQLTFPKEATIIGGLFGRVDYVRTDATMSSFDGFVIYEDSDGLAYIDYLVL